MNLDMVSDGRVHPSELPQQHLTSRIMSRLHMSSKSLPGLWEGMDIPDRHGDGVRFEGKFHQDSTCFG